MKKELHSFRTVQSFEETLSFMKDIDAKTLVVLDVDSTLIVPKTPLLHPQAFSIYKEVVRNLFSTISKEEKHLFNHCIVAHPPMLVEPFSVEWIAKLQKKKIPLIAMTAAKPGYFNEEKVPFHELRFKQLKELGIDFSIHADLDKEFSHLQISFQDYPSLKKGIIYSCGFHNSKGAVLEAFLQDMQKIKKVILFDDKSKHLESVSHILREKFPKMKFLGVHYQGAELLQTKTLVSEEEFASYLQCLLRKSSRAK